MLSTFMKFTFYGVEIILRLLGLFIFQEYYKRIFDKPIFNVSAYYAWQYVLVFIAIVFSVFLLTSSLHVFIRYFYNSNNLNINDDRLSKEFIKYIKILLSIFATILSGCIVSLLKHSFIVLISKYCFIIDLIYLVLFIGYWICKFIYLVSKSSSNSK